MKIEKLKPPTPSSLNKCGRLLESAESTFANWVFIWFVKLQDSLYWKRCYISCLMQICALVSRNKYYHSKCSSWWSKERLLRHAFMADKQRENENQNELSSRKFVRLHMAVAVIEFLNFIKIIFFQIYLFRKFQSTYLRFLFDQHFTQKWKEWKTTGEMKFYPPITINPGICVLTLGDNSHSWKCIHVTCYSFLSFKQ